MSSTQPRATLHQAHDLTRRLFAVVEVAKSDFETIAAGLGLTPLQARTVLSLDEPQPMGDLAAHLSCDASNITGLADRLERLGAVERLPGRDRRVKLLSLTEEGRTLRGELAQRVASGSTVTSRLTAAEREQLSALLDKLLAP